MSYANASVIEGLRLLGYSEDEIAQKLRERDAEQDYRSLEEWRSATERAMKSGRVK